MSALDGDSKQSLIALLDDPSVSERLEMKLNKKGRAISMRHKQPLKLSSGEFAQWSESEQKEMTRHHIYRRFPPFNRIDRATHGKIEPCLRLTWQQLVEHGDHGTSGEQIDSALVASNIKNKVGKSLMHALTQCSACRYTDTARQSITFSSSVMSDYNHFRSCVERYVICKVRQGAFLDFEPAIWHQILYSDVKSDDTVNTLQRISQFCTTDLDTLMDQIQTLEKQVSNTNATPANPNKKTTEKK